MDVTLGFFYEGGATISHCFFFLLCRLTSGELEQDDFDMIQRYVVLLYDRASPCTDVNTCGRMLFTAKGKDVEQMPPTEDALKQHLLRAMLQAM